MNADQLLPLLGHNADDPAVKAVFTELHPRRYPELDPEDRDSVMDWVLVRRQGVELGFTDDVFFHAGPKRKRRGKGVPLVLWQIYFYTARKDISDFKGKLPFGLLWSDERNTVRQKLAAYQSVGRFHIKDTWDISGYRLIVDYRQGGKAIDTILCKLPLLPWPEEGRVQPAMDFTHWLSMLGLPAISTLLQERLHPL